MKEFNWITQERQFFKNNKEDWKLDVMKNALKYLNNPQKLIENKVIHIAGTNGKGSTANYIKNILENSGKHVGLFTSPHLVEYNERIYFNGKFITDDEIELYKNEILNKCKNKNELSFFEVTTLIAILAFSRVKLDYCIFEVGMGGRLDATNIFEKPLLSIITTISHDHTNFLGKTLSKIAEEKGGIIKTGVPVFTSNTKQSIINTLKNIAKQKRTKIFIQSEDYKLDYLLSPSLLGIHQIENATLAKEACKYIGIDKQFILRGIQNTFWPGRLQKICLKQINNKEFKIKDIYLDGAHNKQGISALCKFVNKQSDNYHACKINNKLNSKNKKTTNIIGIFACLERKDYKSFFPILAKSNFDLLLFYNVPKEINDFVPTEKLKFFADKYNINNNTLNDFNELKNYVSSVKDNIIFIFGSLYFVGFVLDKYCN